eukprot:2562-Heterococcus_DN1.PRE.1
MAQLDAAWLAEFAREHGRAPAALFEARLSAVRAELLQQHQQQLEAATAQHQVQVAQNQQQQQELVAVQQMLEAKNQELAASNQALRAVRAALRAVAPIAAAVQQPARGASPEPAANEPANDELVDEPVGELAAAAAGGGTHVAPDVEHLPAKRARVSHETDDSEQRDARKAYAVTLHSLRGCAVSKDVPQAQAAAYWRIFQRLCHADDEGACGIFNTLSEADSRAVASLRTTEEDCLLAFATHCSCLNTMKLLISKGATKSMYNKHDACYGYAFCKSTDTTQTVEALALLVMSGVSVPAAWTEIRTRTRCHWKQSLILASVLRRLLSTLNLDDKAKAALADKLIDVLDKSGAEKADK